MHNAERKDNVGEGVQTEQQQSNSSLVPLLGSLLLIDSDESHVNTPTINLSLPSFPSFAAFLLLVAVFLRWLRFLWRPLEIVSLVFNAFPCFFSVFAHALPSASFCSSFVGFSTWVFALVFFFRRALLFDCFLPLLFTCV